MENTPRKSPLCPFCNSVDAEGRDRALRHNEHAYIILSNPRKVAGHILVIPKRHVEKPWELTSEEIQALFELIGFAQGQILEQKLATGTQVRQNYMPYVPQGSLKVDHVHFHVVPRSFKDELYMRADQFESELFEDLSDKERAEIEPLFS